MKVYSIWTEDEGTWWPDFVTDDKVYAEKVLSDYLRSIGCEYWLMDGMARIEEADVKS